MTMSSRLLFLIGLLVIPTFAQIKPDNKLSKVPAEERARLIKRLNLYFEYERVQKYEEQYELVSNKAVSQPEPSERPSKEQFIRENKEIDTRGTRFVPLKGKIRSVKIHSGPTDHPVYMIWIEMSVNYTGKTFKEDWLVEAHFEKGDWYFQKHRFEI